MSKINAVKRQNYFARVRKRWKRRDVQEIDENHPKFVFTQYIHAGMRSFLQQHHVKKLYIDEHDYKDVTKHEYSCHSSTTPIAFQSFAPAVFYSMRQRIGMSSADYLEIVSPTQKQAYYLEFLSNSKSGQSFFFTNNKQFMIKTITKSEVDFFMDILLRYMEHFNNHPHSLMVKYLGMHSVQVSKHKKPVYFVVMVNIFYPGERIQQRYDIKGCSIGRFTKPAEDGSNVIVILKEKNLKDEKIILDDQRDWFLRQINIDTQFLQGLGVLDYSLLVGVQPLQEDEKLESRNMVNTVIRAQKSYRGACLRSSACDLQGTAAGSNIPGTSSAHSSECDNVSEATTLPGMVTEPNNHPVVVTESEKTEERDDESKAQELLGSIATQQAWCSCSRSYSPIADQLDSRLLHDADKHRALSHSLKCTRKPISVEEAQRQNRRLLPNYRNELHVIDGAYRYYMGLIDFFTRYTFKKKLENAYKRIIYPPLSFSTVHPDIFAERFRKFWEEHTA